MSNCPKVHSPHVQLSTRPPVHKSLTTRTNSARNTRTRTSAFICVCKQLSDGRSIAGQKAKVKRTVHKNKKIKSSLDLTYCPRYVIVTFMSSTTTATARPMTVIREFDARTDKAEDIVAYFHVRTGTVIGKADLPTSPYRGDAMRPLVIG